MEQVRAIAAGNSRDFAAEELRGAGVALEPLLRDSDLVHAYHTVCARDKTALRFYLPAQCAWDVINGGGDAAADQAVARHLIAGLMVVPRDGVPVAPEEDPTWADGALLVECHLLLTREVAERVRTAHVKVRVYPRCAACKTAFVSAEQPRALCRGCGVSFYCGPDCQRGHWEMHRDFCRRMSK